MNSPTATKAKLPAIQAELLTYKMEVQAATYEAALSRHISFALRTGLQREDAVAQLQHATLSARVGRRPRARYRGGLAS
jgi:hypothetical protein